MKPSPLKAQTRLFSSCGHVQQEGALSRKQLSSLLHQVATIRHLSNTIVDFLNQMGNKQNAMHSLGNCTKPYSTWYCQETSTLEWPETLSRKIQPWLLLQHLWVSKTRHLVSELAVCTVRSWLVWVIAGQPSGPGFYETRWFLEHQCAFPSHAAHLIATIKQADFSKTVALLEWF